MTSVRIGGVALLCGLFTVCVGSGHAGAQDSRLHLRRLTSPEPGKVRALVEADSKLLGPTLTAADFTLLLDNSGPARNLAVSRTGDGHGLLTLVVLDDSGSYRSKAGKTLARPAIIEYTHVLTARDRIGLVVFGADAKPYGVQSLASDFLGNLDDPQRATATNRQNRLATNVLAGLGQALGVIKKEQDELRAFPGFSEILLFTDAGDEAAVEVKDWEGLSADAVKGGIRISSIISSPDRGSSDPKRLATLTRLRELANKTDGSYDTSVDLNQVNAQLRSDRETVKNWLLIEGALCGIKPGSSSAAARVDYAPGGNRKAWTEPRTFTLQLDPRGDGAAPCLAAATCTPACVEWQQCDAGKCRAKPCAANENCGTSARCVSGACSPLAASSAVKPGLYWIWALAAGALVLLGLAVLVLVGRKSQRAAPEPPVQNVSLPPPPPPDAPLAPAAPPLPALLVGELPPAAPALNPLLETHLQAIGGTITLGEKWRLHKPKMYVGGSRDPNDGNDIVFNIAAVSSRHALFELFPSGDLWITDLNASNGTYVNGQKLSPKERIKLRIGDQVKLSQQLVLQVVRPGFEPSTRPVSGESVDAAAAKAPVPSKKHTVFDPGNR